MSFLKKRKAPVSKVETPLNEDAPPESIAAALGAVPEVDASDPGPVPGEAQEPDVVPVTPGHRFSWEGVGTNEHRCAFDGRVALVSREKGIWVVRLDGALHPFKDFSQAQMWVEGLPTPPMATV